MSKAFYKRWVLPHSNGADEYSRELVLNYLCLGLIALFIAELLILTYGFLILDQHYLVYRLLSMLMVLVLFIGLFWFSRTYKKYKLIAYLLVGCLFILNTLIVEKWGTVTPTAILVFGMIIVLSGILLGSKFAVYSSLISILILLIFEYLKVVHLVLPDTSWMGKPSSTSDVVGFGVVYFVIAFISWQYNQQMEYSLRRAQKSERALNRQNESLELVVKERTAELQKAQLERVEQIYRFAELGRISSALFHDLANHLATVSLEIEGLNVGTKSKLMAQVQHDIHYIDDIVQRVRLQLRGSSPVKKIAVQSEIKKVVKLLNYRLVQTKLSIKLNLPKQPLYVMADAIALRQVIINLLNNAIEAYPVIHQNQNRTIILSLESQRGELVIQVHDFGMGISKAKQQIIFEPFYSNKANGTGIGLFIVKQIVENDLNGQVSVTSSRTDGTVFAVKLTTS